MLSADDLRQYLHEFRERFGLVADLSQASSLLSWDQQTMMPAAANQHRAQQAASLAGLYHEKLTDPQNDGLLRRLEDNVDRLTAREAAEVRKSRRLYDRWTKLPARLVEDLSRNEAEGQQLWVQARQNNDFALFLPALEKSMELLKRKAGHLGYSDHPYDALHDEYEPGSTTAGIKAVFGPLRDATRDLLARIRNSGVEPDSSLLHRDWPEAGQEQFGREIAGRFGFDFSRGRLDRAVHPFATSIGNRDVRITTRYDRNFISTAIFGILHEAGHGIYEQGIADEFSRSALGGAASLAVHESQSRLWENLIGRSAEFWEFAWPRFSELFADTLAGASHQELHRAVNVVTPSLIRVEADEVTYNLHIMIRFELELALLEGSLAPADLPEAWNGLYRDYLGITPGSDTEGCLQDVHWSIGLLGYFPTYTLGNLMSVQLLDAHRRSNPGLDEQVRTGDFSQLFTWLRDKVHRHGSSLEPGELLLEATGRSLDAAPYVAYLQDKYGRLYGFDAATGEENQ